jgi:MFS superfamily sulfate permease-like transporter
LLHPTPADKIKSLPPAVVVVVVVVIVVVVVAVVVVVVVVIVVIVVSSSSSSISAARRPSRRRCYRRRQRPLRRTLHVASAVVHCTPTVTSHIGHPEKNPPRRRRRPQPSATAVFRCRRCPPSSLHPPHEERGEKPNQG